MKLVPQSVTRSIARKVLTTKKNSPHIFFVGGVIGVFGSTFLACKATLKLEKNLDEIKDDLTAVKMVRAGNKEEQYDDKEYYKDMGYVYAKSAVKLGRLYGPALAVGTVSVAALTGSHIQMTRRNTALTAAFAAVSKAYDDYRERVRNELGEERELELYRCMEDAELEDSKKKVKAVDPNRMSPYAKCFDETNPNYQKDAELNRIFIQMQQNYFNHRLQAYGHVILNDVYDHLGFERTSAGCVVGWILNGDGDNYIDFGMFEAQNQRFMNNMERSIWLDFNVDGVVYDKI
jgi:hypothetical protein